ncbi:PEP/pyruvate-binding domain-containing protein [Candidatus Saccharibacteria bacterium]|nr:PEP/pyruvate-binding domain-containing protein [Candidatus Saccharibacteria bacterium]
MNEVYTLENAPQDAAIIGGKGLSLHKMITAGFSVPPGIVLPQGFDLQMNHKTVLDAFDAQNAPLVAVRSSAVMEDSDTAAWAGQLLTELNVTREGLIDAIRRCQTSGSSAQAQSYAAQHGIEAGGVAVVIQQMVQSEVSGVAFSVHPVTHDSSVVIIEAGLGLGEAIVSGEITPDTYLVKKHSAEIKERHISVQEKALKREGNITSYRSLGEMGSTQKLPDKVITQLASVVEKLEVFEGRPVDVEWAFATGKLYITQCRPITTV